MKKLIICVTALVSGFSLFAQRSIRLQFIDQYEAPIDYVTVIDSASQQYKTDDLGFAAIGLPLYADSVRITNAGYETRLIPITTLRDGSTVTLKKDFSWKDLVNPMFYIIYGGLWLLLFIVFAETGLFVGFFLPGDSLLFVAGIYSNNLAHELLKVLGLGDVTNEWVDLLALVPLIALAGILGNSVGYWFGRKIGPAMYNWRDRFLFKKKYLYEAHEFSEKHGGGAIIFARFLPIVRTFAPIVAGIVQMEKSKFMFFNIVGSFAWVITMVLAGHFLQIWIKRQFGFELKDHLEMIVIGIVLVTTAPVLWKLFFSKRKKPA